MQLFPPHKIFKNNSYANICSQLTPAYQKAAIHSVMNFVLNYKVILILKHGCCLTNSK